LAWKWLSRGKGHPITRRETGNAGGRAMRINYQGSKLTINDVSMDLFMKIVQTVEQHEADNDRKQKAEEWRSLAEEPGKYREIS
jgi:hypothetical protein